MSERPYTDADVETVATAIEDAGGAAMTWGEHKDAARAVLDALTAAGWRQVRGIVRFDGYMSAEQIERFRAAWERSVAAGQSWSYEVYVRRLPWWRRLWRGGEQDG